MSQICSHFQIRMRLEGTGNDPFATPPAAITKTPLIEFEIMGCSSRFFIPCRLLYHSGEKYYSLVGRDYEYELMPLALDQNVGALVAQLAAAQAYGFNPSHWGRNEEQLMQNLGAERWRLTPEQVAKLDEASKSAVPLSLLAPTSVSGSKPVPPSVGQ
jgi:hypothetical protein